MAGWNPWHGCRKLSEGCRNCYVYRIDARHGKDSREIVKTRAFDFPVQRNRRKEYKLLSGTTVYTCFSSDFFLEDADVWRPQAWEIIRERSDLYFLIVTKRIDRFNVGLPTDWENGYDHVTVCCTVENQDRADYRLPIYRELPIRHKVIICEPLLEAVNLRPYLGSWVEEVMVGGESGEDARICNYDWVLDIRQQCVEYDITFRFRQTGARLLKDGHVYCIPRSFQQEQAHKAGIDFK